MRRSKTLAAALLTTAVVASPVMATSAFAAPAQDVTGTTCSLLSPLCTVTEAAEQLLAPVTDAIAPVVETVESTVPVPAPVAEVIPAPAPTPAPAPQPSPAPPASGSSSGSSGSFGGTTTATSSSSPSGFIGPVSTTRPAGPKVGSPVNRFGVPSVPMGSSLSLSPLGPLSSAPSFASPSTGADLSTPALASEPVIETVRAAVSSPDESKATAVALALSVLALAAGLLIDRARKARLPIKI
ncbi:MAG TPA: hypothetical protein VFV32_15825 [Acidimicrobiales bacterium]|nr:hypothetical protein [Acidimicrobiales bacterium]